MRRLCLNLGKFHLNVKRRTFKASTRCFSLNKPSTDDKMDFASMKVAELRSFLDTKGLPTNGSKQMLVDRASSYWNHLQRHKSSQLAKPDRESTKSESPVNGNAASEATTSPLVASSDEVVTSARVESPLVKVESPTVADKSEFVIPGLGPDVVENTAMKEGCVVEDTQIKESNVEVQIGEASGQLEQGSSEAVVADVRPGKKRRSRSLVYPKKRKRMLTSVPKNALQILNERTPGLKYELVSQTGTPNNPLFKMSVTVDGVEYTGEGSSKKAAKHAAAAKVLDTMGFAPIPIAPPPLPLEEMMFQPIDFTSDDPMWYGCEFAEMVQIPLAEPQIAPQMAAFPQPPSMPPGESKSDGDRAKAFASDQEAKHPVMILHEMCSDITYSPAELTSSKTYIIKAAIDGAEYGGEGRSKKLAKQALAIKVLKEKFGIISRQHPEQLPVASSDSGEDNVLIADAGRLPDLISDLVKSKFKDLTDGTPHAARKVLAGIVRTREFGPEVAEGEVICIATGTKCISGDHISIMGTALNDCHAEVVCRRALRKYLYDQLLLYASDGEASIFEACDGTDGAKGYRLKPDVFFHLYINTSPCGDSRIFSPHETQKQGDDHPNRKARGLLRTKIEVGEGTIPVLQHESQIIDGIQPWDSVIGGERLLTMSCSDKLARWNLLGMQGSLLSMYIEPVYFSSIILGSLYHSAHFSRGVYTRVKDAMHAFNIQQKEADQPPQEASESAQAAIEKPFKMHRPLLASVSVPEKRRAGGKAPSFCLHWTVGDESPTVLNTVTGMGDQSSVSYLCKMETFRLFHQLLAEKRLLPKVAIPEAAHDLSYSEVKDRAVEYQALKENLHTGFKALGLGTWVKKPPEVDSFLLKNLSAEDDK